MSFASPVMLLALLAVPIAFAAWWLMRGRANRYAVRFPAVSTLVAVMPTPPAWRRYLPVGLFLAALAALALALAKPEAPVDVPVEQASIVLVSDASRSMLATDVKPSRLQVTEDAAKHFIDNLPGEARVGLVGFSDTPHTVEAPSKDHTRVRDEIAALTADGGTATGDALSVALGMVNKGPRQGRAPAAIVLLSDGKATVGRDPEGVAEEARQAGIPIYTVALGTDSGTVDTPGGILGVPPNPEAMRTIARVSGGKSFEVSDADGLETVYDQLGSKVATKKQKREISVAFAAGGLMLLLGAAGFGLRSAGRLP